MTDSCGGCKFYKRHNETDGTCRRYPATVVMVGAKQGTLGPVPVTMGFYPQVGAAGDWCGEHRPVIQQ